MKKLLSILSVLTISGTAVPTTIAASPYQKNEQITNNSENLKRNKRENSMFNFGITTNIFKINSTFFNYIIHNNKLYFISKSNKIYKYDFKLNTKDIFLEIEKTDYFISSIKFDNMMYFLTKNGKFYEYDINKNKTKIIFEINIIKDYSDDVEISIINKNFYFNLYNAYYFKIYNYNFELNEKKFVFEKEYSQPYNFNNIVFNNKLYFGVLNDVYEYDPMTNKSKIVITTNDEIYSSGIVLNDKLYFGSSDKNVYEYNSTTCQQKIVIRANGPIISSGVVLDNKLYFGSSDHKLYSYDPVQNKQDIELAVIAQISFSPIVFNKKIYLASADNLIYEYNPITWEKKFIISSNKKINFPLFGLNKKIYLISLENNNIYEYEPLELIESNTIDLQEQIKRGLYLYYQKQNPNSYVKNIEFNMDDLKYYDIELIEQEKDPSVTITNTIYKNNNEVFTNEFTEDVNYKTIEHEYTEETIDSVQLIRGINKRIDNTLESGESTANTVGTTEIKTKTTGINVGAEVSAGWGPVSASISSSVTSEEGDTHQTDNSQSKTKNISKVISNSNSYDLSNMNERSTKKSHTTKIQSQSFTVRPDQKIIVKTNLNQIIKKYKVTFKQKISGKIKVKIINEYGIEEPEQEFLIKDIFFCLKENNLLPQEIILDNNNVFFKGAFFVGKTEFESNLTPKLIDLN